MVNLLRSGLIMLLLLSGCGSNGTPTRHNDFVPLTSIEIVPEVTSIAANHTIASLTSTKLTVIGNFSGLFQRDITDQAIWASDLKNFAEFVTVAQPNRVTGKTPGSATLTATVGSVSSTFKLTVSTATISTMAITPLAPSIAKGLITQFAVSGVFSDSTTQDLTFDAIWTSDTPAVATVSDDPVNKGFAKAIDIGSANIKAAFDTSSVSTLMTVTAPVVQSITVTPANSTVLSLLTSGSFSATGTFSDGSTQDITSRVTWSSSNTAIATIATTGGPANTLAQGSTTISATPFPSLPSDAGVSGSTTLKVTGGTLNGFTMSTGSVTLLQGTVGRMSATGQFIKPGTTNLFTRDITDLVTWSVADTTKATVTAPSGNLVLINALSQTAAGVPTTISAAIGSLNSKANLTVSAPTLSSLAITFPPGIADLTVGTSTRLTLTATFSDGSIQDVTANATWASSNSGLFSVDNSSALTRGRVTGIAAGSPTTPPTVTASFGGQTTSPVNVPVTARTLSKLDIFGTTFTLASGNQVKYSATATYNAGTSAAIARDVTEDTTWSLDKPFVAILADNTIPPGQVVAVDSGTATLTATFGGLSSTAPITVTVP